jgi:hypothetical protein
MEERGRLEAADTLPGAAQHILAHVAERPVPGRDRPERPVRVQPRSVVAAAEPHIHHVYYRFGSPVPSCSVLPAAQSRLCETYTIPLGRCMAADGGEPGSNGTKLGTGLAPPWSLASAPSKANAPRTQLQPIPALRIVQTIRTVSVRPFLPISPSVTVVTIVTIRRLGGWAYWRALNVQPGRWIDVVSTSGLLVLRLLTSEVPGSRVHRDSLPSRSAFGYNKSHHELTHPDLPCPPSTRHRLAHSL